MSDSAKFMLQFAVMAGVIAACSYVGSKARERGRGEWLSLVGRPPRDLYANRRVNFFANLIHEWGWIGFSVIIAGWVMYFPDATDGIATYVVWLGIAMIGVNVIGNPICLLYAKLAPQYEVEAAERAATRSTVSPDAA